MKHLTKNLVALGAAVAVVACGRYVLAQDDLDDLLKDLEAEASDTAEVAPAAESLDEGPDLADAEPEAEEAGEDAGSPADGSGEGEDEEVEESEEPAADEEADSGEPSGEEEEPSEEAADSGDSEEEPAGEDETAAVEEDGEAADGEDSADAEEPAEADETAEEPADETAEEPAEETAEEPAEDDAEEVAETAEETAGADEEAGDEVADAGEAEEPAEDTPASDAKKAGEVLNLLNDLAAEADSEPEEPAEEPAAAPAVAAPAPAPAAVPPAPAVAAAPKAAPAPVAAPEPRKSYMGPNAELIANIEATERIRREAFDKQAKREIDTARKSMQNGEFQDATRHYGVALKLLNDSPASAGLRKECRQGIAEGLYRAALQEEVIGRRESAKRLMEKAVDMRHPKASRQLEVWNSDDNPDKNKTELSAVTQRRNDADYKELRAKNLQHLKRARQLLGTHELDRALEECELVLLSDPYNQAALRIRNAIEKKRRTVFATERQAAREGMLADVDKAWRPVYAVDAVEIGKASASTMKRDIGEGDLVRAQEQIIEKRMRAMRLPTISFKEATLSDALDVLFAAARDYDRPDLPLEQRGFNYMIKSDTVRHATAAPEEAASEGFGGDEEETSDQSGEPLIQSIKANDISFYEALQLVCEQVQYKFRVKESMVIVMPKSMSMDEMTIRNYPVLSSFMEKMDTASSDMKEMRSAGFGGASSSRRNDDAGGENQERDWKEFFEMLGVKWPEGSSIMYLKSVGKLRVKNTAENLADLEKALNDLNVEQKLIEIEARFVEVCQEDLNSLGFEWILNSDLSLNVGKHISRALNLKSGKWGSETGSITDTRTRTSTLDSLSQNGGSASVLSTDSTVRNYSDTRSSTTTFNGNGSSWSRNYGSRTNKRAGLSAFGGDSDYGTGMRYLSTDSNHISGQSSSDNDQFMRLNAFIGNADLSMILHMLSQRNDTDLLSAPKVLTKPGENAVIKVVTEFIYPTDYDVQIQSSSSSGREQSQSGILAVVEPQGFTMREVGVILDVTPTLTDDGNLIDLKFKTEVVDEPTWKNYGMRIPFTGNSSLQSFEGIGDILTGLSEVLESLGTGISDTVKATFAQTAVDSASNALDSLTEKTSQNITYYDAPMEQPFFHVRSIDSSVSVYPGATIIMGGLITERRKAMDDKIPFLGDLPFVGRFFRSHSEQTSKRNLLIFVTTRLVDVRGREVTMSESEENEGEVKAAPEEE